MARWLHFALFRTCLIFCLLLQTGALPPPNKIPRSNPLTLRKSEEGDPSASAAALLRAQLKNPAEILAVLLIIGGDIIQKACAQLSCGKGHFVPPPVAFSFGWVAYAFGALMSAFGDGSLMPAPDISAIVATVGGQWKTNESWVLGRLVRDLEIKHTRDPGGMRVVFYRTNGDSSKPKRDGVWMSFLIFIPIQFGVAAAPLHHKNWSILMITAIGTALAITTGSLPQWREEKYFRGRDNAKGTYILTRGNGHGHAFVIRISQGDKFINFDDFAITRTRDSWLTRGATVILSIFWIVLLITVAGMKEDTWFLLLVGLIGMFQNVWVAGSMRSSDGHGIPLKLVGYFDTPKVEPALKAAEELYPGVGLALIQLFFPAGLRPEQTEFWAGKYREFWAEKNANAGADLNATPGVDQNPNEQAEQDLNEGRLESDSARNNQSVIVTKTSD